MITDRELIYLRLIKVLSDEGLLTRKRFFGMTATERKKMLDRVIWACAGATES